MTPDVLGHTELSSFVLVSPQVSEKNNKRECKLETDSDGALPA